MSKKSQTIYFDEAGFTGNNLLDLEQPVFVYTGIALDEDHASQIHSDVLSRFKITAPELKHASLVKQKQGREAISWILDQCSKHSRVMIANKEYTLAGKFFEYIFEPVLSARNSLFYSIDFHKFIATYMYLSFKAGDPHAMGILNAFAEMMRSLDPSKLETILSYLDHMHHLDQADMVGKILTFCNRKSIESELRGMAGQTELGGNWILELSMTALHWLLSSWGEEYEVLEVYCDRSKPIQEAQWLFEAFIGREDKAYIKLGSQKPAPITYNLLGPINLIDSKQSYGVQIADVMSGSIAYAFKNPDEEFSKEWLKLMKDVPSNRIAPDLSQIDLTQEVAFVNTAVLLELVNRSIKGQNPFTNMEDIIAATKSIYPRYLSAITSNGC